MAGEAGGAAPPVLPERIAFLGFGLIGGSMALALRAAGVASRLIAWSPGGRGPHQGLERGLVDEVAKDPGAAVEGAGLVVLAGPPLAILDALGEPGAAWRASLAPDATVTDVGSTKARIVAAADAAGLPFVGGHPMAGRETAGVGAATADLFRERPWVVVAGERARPADLARVEALARAVGARPIRLGAAEHDAAVAGISHLPLVMSAALVESVAGGGSDAGASWPIARELAASGWRDTTRLARGDPAMGAGMLATNAPEVAARLHALRGVIDAWLEALERSEVDADDLRRRLDAARAVAGTTPGPAPSPSAEPPT